MPVAINTDFREILKGYSNKWVALSADNSKVVGAGDSPKDAIEQAGANGEMYPVLTKVPERDGTFIL